MTQSAKTKRDDNVQHTVLAASSFNLTGHDVMVVFRERHEVLPLPFHRVITLPLQGYAMVIDIPEKLRFNTDTVATQVTEAVTHLVTKHLGINLNSLDEGDEDGQSKLRFEALYDVRQSIIQMGCAALSQTGVLGELMKGRIVKDVRNAGN